MLSTTFLLAVAATVLAAAPSPFPEFKGYSIPLIWNPHFDETAATDPAYIAARYASYARDNSAEAVATDPNTVAYGLNHQWTAKVQIGTNSAQKPLQLVMDTGSSDLWVYSSEIIDPAQKTDNGGHNWYDPGHSGTWKLDDDCWFDISFFDGTGATGKCGTDKVTVGDGSGAPSFPSQYIEIAQTIKGAGFQAGMDGFLGMGFKAASQIKSIATNASAPKPTFFDNIATATTSAVKVFGAYIPKNDATRILPGSYDFGDLDPAHYRGDIKYINLDNGIGANLWQFPATQIKAGDTVLPALTYTFTLVDTGTTGIAMATVDCDNYYNTYKAQNIDLQFDATEKVYHFPCDADIPVLSIEIGDNQWATLTKEFMSFKIYGDASKNRCQGALYPFDTDNAVSRMNVLGGAFFNAYYGVFDYQGPDATANPPVPRFGYAPNTAPLPAMPGTQ